MLYEFCNVFVHKDIATMLPRGKLRSCEILTGINRMLKISQVAV